MTDTPQPATAGENATLDDAAAIFKAAVFPQADKPRDEQGRFAPAQTDAEADEEDGELEATDAGDDTGEADETDEAADEAQPDAAPMPASWSSEDEEVWQALPPEAKAKLAEREGQREAAVNAKFQESANARKAAEAEREQANANRDAYARAIDDVVSLVSLQEPDPYQYGLGTENYDRDSYDLAQHQYRQASAQIQHLLHQRQTIANDQENERRNAQARAVAEIEAEAFPKFVADAPDLKDPTKAQQLVSALIDYGIRAGIPQDAFVKGSPNQATSREMHLLWKASEYDRIKAAGQRVKAGNPPPKPSTPVVKPGGVTPRQTIKATRLDAANARLAKSGSVEDAAQVFKHMFSR